jgi:small subunit ribosomal protein S17
MTATRNARRQMQGVVTSTRSRKTITVQVERTYKHPKYGKYVRKQSKYLAHDEAGTATVGDVVEIVATRPLSKRKRWRLLRVLGHADPTGDEIGGVEFEGGAE